VTAAYRQNGKFIYSKYLNKRYVVAVLSGISADIAVYIMDIHQNIVCIKQRGVILINDAWTDDR
jgi:hypothetical protein